MKQNEKYSNYDEGIQSFLLQNEQRYPSNTHYDYKPPPASSPPPYDHQPPPPYYEQRPPPPTPPDYDHRSPQPDYDHRPPPPHHDHRLPPPHYNYRPPPPHYEHDLPPPSPRHQKDPSPYEKEPSQHHYTTYDYNSLSSQPPSDYDDRHIRQSSYYDRSYSRDLTPPPRNEGRPPPQYHYDDRPPPPHHDGPPPPHNHNNGPHYPRPTHDPDRSPPPPRHSGRPPPPHNIPTSFHNDNRHPPPPPGDRLPNYNWPSNECTSPFDNNGQSNQEIVLDYRRENTGLSRDTENILLIRISPTDEIQKNLKPKFTDNNKINKSYSDNFKSLIDVRFAEDNDKIPPTLKTERTTLQNSMDSNSDTQEKIPKFTQLLFQAIPVTPES